MSVHVSMQPPRRKANLANKLLTLIAKMLGSWLVKVGCAGCLVLVVEILVLLMVAGGALFLSTNIFGTPPVPSVAFSRADGYSAQQKLYEIVQRQIGQSSRKDPISLTES